MQLLVVDVYTNMNVEEGRKAMQGVPGQGQPGAEREVGEGAKALAEAVLENSA
jgi:hypothetical protein